VTTLPPETPLQRFGLHAPACPANWQQPCACGLAEALDAETALIEAAVQAECWLACMRPDDGVTPDEMLRVLRAALAGIGVK